MSCNLKTDKQIQEMLETHHEEEMKAAISAYEEYYRTGNSFFEKKEFGGIQKTDAFNELLNNIKNIHTEYHNSEAIP